MHSCQSSRQNPHPAEAERGCGSVAAERNARGLEFAAPLSHGDVLTGRPVLIAALHCGSVLEMSGGCVDAKDSRN